PDHVGVGADVLAAHDGQRLEPRLHREYLPYPHRRIRGDRLDRIAQATGRRILRRGRLRALYPLDERLHVAVPRVEGDHEVVVADVAWSAQLGPGAVPRVLVVQHHRPAHQRLEPGDVLIGLEDR